MYGLTEITLYCFAPRAMYSTFVRSFEVNMSLTGIPNIQQNLTFVLV